MIVDVQFNAGTTPWPQYRDAVLAAEDAGFGVAWVLDHLAGGVLRGDSMLECFTLVGALSVATERIGIGTLVANVWNRSLGALAVAAASAQTISGGRFWLGIGAGASPKSPFGVEQAAVGIELEADVNARHQRVSDFVHLARDMWADGTVAGVHGFPVPPLPIPTIVGVNSVALARIAATLTDGINVRANHPRLDEIIDAAREARPAGTEPLLVTTWDVLSDELQDPDSTPRRRYERLGVDRLIVVQFDPVDVGRMRLVR